MKKSCLIFIAIICALMLVGPTNIMAKGLYEHQDTVVPQEQVVDDVVVIGGDAAVWGTVNDSVIVFNGDLDIKASAKITGFVLVVGGSVKQEQGAVITNQIINVSFDDATKNSLLIGGGMVVGAWLLQLAASMLLVVLPVLTVYFSRQRMNLFVHRARQSPGQLVSVGFFGTLILIALTILLIVTIIGIPIALLILLLAVLAFVFGMAVLSLLVGERIQGMSGRSNWLICLLGSIVLVSLMNVPLIGLFVFLGTWLLSIGIMMMWVLEKVRKKPSSKS